MTQLALDYARPVGVAQLPAGVGVLRYWPKQGGSAVVVGLGRDEISGLKNTGRPFATVYEAPAATWMAGGYGAGQQAGRWLASQFEASGHTPRAVYLAADSNTLSTAAVNACLDGAASVLGRGVVGLYGYLPQLVAAHAGGHASWWWLTGRYVDPAAYPWIHVYQCQGSQPPGVPTTMTVGGQRADVNMIFRPDWGQHEETSMDWAAPLPNPDYPNSGDPTYPASDFLTYANQKAGRALDAVNALTEKVDALTTQVGQLATLLGPGVTLGATGQITVGPVAPSTGKSES